MRSILFVLLAFVLSPCTAQTTYYVNGNSGADANDGLTDSTAWKTVQKAFDSATPGSTVMIRGGNYPENPVLHVSGTVLQPIVFRSHQGTATIIGQAVNGPVAIMIEDQSHVELRGLRLQNMVTPDACGVLIRATANGGVQNVRLVNMTLRYLGWTFDPFIPPGPDDRAHAVRVVGEGLNPVNAVAGVILDSLLVTENTIGRGAAIAIEGHVDGFLLRGGAVHDHPGTGILISGHQGVCANSELDQPRNGRLSGIHLWSDRGSLPDDAGIRVDGGRDILIERCRSLENGFGIAVDCSGPGAAQQVTLRDNLIFLNRRAGLVLGGEGGGSGEVLACTVRNNSFFRNDLSGSGIGELLLRRASDCDLRNNLFLTTGQAVLLTREELPPQANNTADHNAWFTGTGAEADAVVQWGTYTLAGFTAYRAATGWDATGFFTDPLLEDTVGVAPDLRPSAASPCVDAGDPATAVALDESDHAGAPRITGAHIDIGAYEWAAPDGLFELPAEIVVLWPNPCSGQLVLPDGSRDLKVYDPLGHLLFSTLRPGPVLNTSALPEGLLLFRLRTLDGTVRSARVLHQAR